MNHRNPLIYLGGAKRDRTADLLNAIQALSQLSYSPLVFLTAFFTMLRAILSRIRLYETKRRYFFPGSRSNKIANPYRNW